MKLTDRILLAGLGFLFSMLTISLSLFAYASNNFDEIVEQLKLFGCEISNDITDEIVESSLLIAPNLEEAEIEEIAKLLTHFENDTTDEIVESLLLFASNAEETDRDEIAQSLTRFKFDLNTTDVDESATTTMGTHQVKVMPKEVPTLNWSNELTKTYVFISGNIRIKIKNNELIVNEKDYGKIQMNSTILIEQGKVFISSPKVLPL
jgi:hypothetical protein